MKDHGILRQILGIEIKGIKLLE